MFIRNDITHVMLNAIDHVIESHALKKKTLNIKKFGIQVSIYDVTGKWLNKM